MDLGCGECNVISFIFCVVLLMDHLFVLCVACLIVFVNFLLKQFAIFLGVVVILLLNVMEVLRVGEGEGEGSLLDRPCLTKNLSVTLVIPMCILMFLL